MRLSQNNAIPFAYGPRNRRGLSGLGIDPSTLLSLGSAFVGAMGDKSGGGGAIPAPGEGMPGGSTTTVSPAIQTTISPQISPVFQQSYMPQNSGMTAGTTQLAPSTHTATTGTPGLPDLGLPSDLSLPSDTSLPAPSASSLPARAQSAAGMARYLPYILGGAALIGLALFFKSKKKKKSNAA